ncbi:diaminopimelate epimerase [Candidatus Poriferisocius sp.]|uniref:diaminopimelate epimerase n=1 Tax=Candidatus Poriferisocius sp. TaxID=3101276 RepID=UPI003B01936E
MRLTKHHGLGNDFLVAMVDSLPEDASARAREVCHRTRGVGADGLLWGLPGDPAMGTDATMVLFNADGTRAEMSGNGIRCLAQAIVESGHDGVAQAIVESGHDGVSQAIVESGHDGVLRIGTDAGVRTVWIEATEDRGMIRARVDMGPIGPGPELASIDYSGGLRFMTVEVGNPHLVVEVADAGSMNVSWDGYELSRAAGGINVEFVSRRAGDQGIDMRVWERGVGETQACGTGACAAAHAAQEWGLVDGREVSVFMLGGEVVVELDETAVLTGPAVRIATIDHGGNNG